MIRVSKEITTGRILCSQGGALPDVATMLANARSAFPDMLEEEIEVVDLTEEEFAAALAEQNAPTVDDMIEAVIAEFAPRFHALKNQILTALIADGAGMDANIAALRSEWSALADEQDAAILALFE